MAIKGCVKYPLCVEWMTQIPFEDISHTSPNIVLLEGIECNLELRMNRAMIEEYYSLYVVFRKQERLKALKKFTVTTFIRGSSDSDLKLSAYTQLSHNNKSVWSKSKGEILKEIPNISNINKLTILCLFHSTDIHLGKNHSDYVSGPSALNSVHLHNLSLDFLSLLEDETFSDVKLICGDRTFSANTFVLAARSEVFAAMFRNKLAEAKTGVVHIKDVDPELLELLLRYLYCGEIPLLCPETAHSLYEAADKYAVHGLREACSDFMVEFQTTDNCLDLLLLGDKHSDEMLKDAVACFVAKHLPDLGVESWSTFKKNYPLLALSVLEKRCEDSMPGTAKRAKIDFQ